MVMIDGNGRDGGGRRENIPLNLFSFFSLLFSLFLSFSPFFLASFFSFIFVLFCFCNKFFSKIFQNFKRIYTK